MERIPGARRQRFKMLLSGWLKKVGAILLFLVGLAVLIFLAINLAYDLPIWVFGVRVPAKVIMTWYEPIIVNEEFIDARYFIRYQFLTEDGRRFEGVSTLDPGEWIELGDAGPTENFHPGQRRAENAAVEKEQGTWVLAKYVPFLPSINRLDDTRFIPVLACAYLPWLAIGCYGLCAGRKLLRC